MLIGCILLGAYAAHAFWRRTHVPRVTLLLLIGIAVEPEGLDVVPVERGEFVLHYQPKTWFVGSTHPEALSPRRRSSESPKRPD